MTDPRWQPIETAPKDGTEILLTDGHWKRTGWWAKRIGSWSIDAAVSLTMPTLWAPLPDPPAASAEPSPLECEPKDFNDLNEDGEP